MTQEMIIAEVLLEFVFNATIIITSLAFLFGIFTRALRAINKEKND